MCWTQTAHQKVSQSYIDSTSKFAEDQRYWVRDKKTKEIGLIYTVANIRWFSKHTVTVNDDCFGGGHFAGTSTHTLRRKGKLWKVTRSKSGPWRKVITPAEPGAEIDHVQLRSFLSTLLTAAERGRSVTARYITERC